MKTLANIRLLAKTCPGNRQLIGNILKTAIFTMLCLIHLESHAQFALKTYEFPEYGFKVPFFSNVEMSKENAGTVDEVIRYSFRYNDDTYEGTMLCYLEIYPNNGCIEMDTLFKLLKTRAGTYNGMPFNVKSLVGGTNPFAWTNCSIETTHEASYYGDNVYRVLQGFSIGKSVVILDCIHKRVQAKEQTDKIFDKPGFASTPVVQSLPEYKLQMSTRGNVLIVYIKDGNFYELGRCDTYGKTYPFARMRKINKTDPGVQALSLLSDLRLDPKNKNIDFSTLPESSPMTAKFGKTARVSHQVSAYFKDINKEVPVDVVHYLFNFEGNSYWVSIFVHHVENGDRLDWYNERYNPEMKIFSGKDVPKFEERLQEYLITLKKMP